MIPNLLELWRRVSLAPVFAALMLAGLLTSIVFFAQSIAAWFDDRNP